MLNKHPVFPGINGPLLTIVMDGIGIGSGSALEGNAVRKAWTPTLDFLLTHSPHTLLKAHGLAVGMPSDDDMGNSEVGHNAMGAGRIYHQGAALVNEAIQSGGIFRGDAWLRVIRNVREHDSTLHFLGLFSDGNVHAHIDHLKAMIVQARQQDVGRVRVHVLLDGRDVPETSALDYLQPFETFLDEMRGENFDIRIASGGGRMSITMDRYEADWAMVERGWQTHVLGNAPYFDNAVAAVNGLRAQHPGVGDQDLPPFVIADAGEPVGRIEDHDSVVFFNFRGDRAMEISRAFEESEFSAFDRVHVPDIVYAGMLQYDGDLHIPKHFLVDPPAIRNTMSEFLAHTGVAQLAISETQKFGHVTYFWNGNRSGKFDEKLETYIEIPSDLVPFQQRPWMKSAEITDELIVQLQSGRHRFLRVNYANGDMVGHTGNLQAATLAVETVDLALSRILPVIDALQGAAIITADHGNADEMYELNRKTGEPQKNADGSFKPKTSHTLNPVPFILYGNTLNNAVTLADIPAPGLSNIASTTVNLLGYEAPECWDTGLLAFN
ncbi:2,3-bisphosphoglycerate-independent phosphoglycerate mutase [Candidatus Methylospira mobilis]|uniref:2,3-bisphosphoglycerate-independent phosphoglycerate mutase n=1 Tax=Candidatus Methylospira mobilis TaxID=1808979 RepID=A0A5Q0BNB5_9GAMM|nr:2,3-bisphosphoglycerate-independent phosphoglycerate mutase [Candidatus Methylospira mobilis]QFY45089.1 2,3-bisphosphoglycerate-independent phosphoglycerate mutase [Candidatus Methylospira mobilis]